ILLPRQFHVAVVENHSKREIHTAAWLFPLYLVLINIFVLPIAIAGLLSFPPGSVDADMFVLALPLSQGANVLAMFAFVGGLSAATAMVIVASIALAIMVCNEIAVPLMLRRAATRAPDRDEFAEIGPLLLNIRRAVIFLILMLAYGFHRTIGQSHALASIGLLSFAAIAQFAPAFFVGLFWRRATATGAIAGISVGFAMWAYTMFLPWIANAGWIPTQILHEGPWGVAFLRPEALLGVDMSPLVHGVFWSVTTNIAVLLGVSLLRMPHPVERLQANLFLPGERTTGSSTPAFRLWRSSITVQDLMRTAARYVGAARAERSFEQYAEREKISLDPNNEADVQTIQFTERLLASAIGAASSRLVLSLLLRRKNVGHRSALKLLDDASEAIHYNRDLLQSALDQMGQGISVFDEDLQLICWNRRFRELLDLPAEFGAVGVPLDRIIQYKAEAGHYGDVDIAACVSERVGRIALTRETFQDANLTDNRVLEIATRSMPQGGVVTTYTDITERVDSAEALARANESLERRVRERTAQLTDVNKALAEAKTKADEANLDKTRFLAAAGHDILQPLNAARLYTGSMTERARGTPADDLAQRIDASLEAVEEIISALLDISRLDANAMEPEYGVFSVADLFERLRLEFEPSASAKGLDLRFVKTGAWIRSDRRLLRRVLQNLISNAIKYTDEGKVVVGCRHTSNTVRIQVHDTGFGIPDTDRETIFREFQRLDKDAHKVRGLGLGLSIVQRIADVLGHPVDLDSRLDHGSTFSISIPAASPVVRPIDEAAARHLGHNLSGTTVLVIDNEPEIVQSTEILLSGWGCSVITAGGEAEAYERAESAHQPPDIILADYHLSDALGTDAVSAIRARLGDSLPAIIITADRSQAVQRKIRDAGLTLMRKPVRPAALRAAIYQLKQKPIAAE
ncbi:MAG: hybrid sensor histidine kinase/response regulator, partial [Hyphomicrobiaceae bacterium]